MKVFEIDVKTTAKAKITVKAPDRLTALEYINDVGFEAYNFDWEVDEYDGELDAGVSKPDEQGKRVFYGIRETCEQTANYNCDLDWLRENGYEILVRKREVKVESDPVAVQQQAA